MLWCSVVLLNSGRFWFGLNMNGILVLVSFFMCWIILLKLFGLMIVSLMFGVLFVWFRCDCIIVFGWNVVIWLLLRLVVIIVCVVYVLGSM